MIRPLVAAIVAIAVLSWVAPEPLAASNRQNPRWEAERSGRDFSHELTPPHQQHKPYRPLHEPPGALPPHQRGASLVLNPGVLLGLATIFILGITAEWLSWIVRLPSPLLLLLAGFVAGPATGFLDPDALLGNLLLPVVSLSLAVLLFEQCLNLRTRAVAENGGVVGSLLSLGVLVAWAINGIGACYVLGLPTASAGLLGAILVVSAPTVIGPLIDSVGPRDAAADALRWESVGLDLIGAALAVMVFETIVAGGSRQTAVPGIAGILKTTAIAAGAGGLGAAIMLIALDRKWVPQRLASPLTLMTLVAAVTLADAVQEESGLLAAVAMGLALAYQRRVDIQAVRELQGLPAMLAAPLFVVLAARLQVADVFRLGVASAAFVAIVVLVGRPLAVAASTARSGMSWRERVWLSWVAPRGVIAAGLASLCGLRLVEIGYPQADRLVPLVFLVISVSAVLSSFTVAPAAQWLRLARAEPHEGAQTTERSSIATLVRGPR
ncbi:MAG TPA: cation:proton antiporter [Candidatus Acidoferrales bacterium]|nr:cation:proton antiporter [Candidatus Acidoferrales bacterium]